MLVGMLFRFLCFCHEYYYYMICPLLQIDANGQIVVNRLSLSIVLGTKRANAGRHSWGRHNVAKILGELDLANL